MPAATRCAIPSPPISFEDGYDVRTIRELLGHADVKKTMIDTHVLQQTGGRRARSPMDTLLTGGRR
jgi:integrase